METAAQTGPEQMGEYLKLGERYGLAPLMLLLGFALLGVIAWRAGRFLAPLIADAFAEHGSLIKTLQTNSNEHTEAVGAIRGLLSSRGEQLDRVERKLDTIHGHLTGKEPERPA